MRAFIGAATSQGRGSPAAGISIVDIDGAEITQIGVAKTEFENPMYLTLSHDGTVLYASHAVADGRVSAWRVAEETLLPLGEARSTHGRTPCHLSIDASGKYLLNADYGSGSISVHPILDDGSLGPASDIVQHTGSGPTQRQRSSHAHMVLTDEATGQILAVDLGADAIYRYTLDDGQLVVVDTIVMPAGSGPRHLDIFDRTAYVAGELDSTLSIVDLDAGQVITAAPSVPSTATGSNPSAIRVAPDGRHVLVANRGPDTIGVLDVTGPGPRLVHTEPTRGNHPRDMTLSPDGSHVYAANQFSDSISVHRFDVAAGTLEPVGDLYATPSPACILFAA